ITSFAVYSSSTGFTRTEACAREYEYGFDIVLAYAGTFLLTGTTELAVFLEALFLLPETAVFCDERTGAVLTVFADTDAGDFTPVFIILLSLLYLASLRFMYSMPALYVILQHSFLSSYLFCIFPT